MRRLSLLTAVALALACVPVASAKTLFVLNGRGWGHAVGMSQWGAYGQAKQGRTYEQILANYYQGTTIGVHPNQTIRVLLAGGRTSLTLGSSAAFSVGAQTHGPGLAQVTKTAQGRIRVEGLTGTFASPVTLAPTGGGLLQLGVARYRGTIVVTVVGGRLRAVNHVGLEHYVRGVVPRESPSTWPAAALQAQAVAARSYALASGGHCGGGLFCPDTSDQVYGGADAERASTNAAVAATAGRVVLYGGAVAQTFFSSSNGGRSAAAVDAWGSAVPYLVSVPDPADLNAANPNRSWRVLRTALELRRGLGLQRTPNDGTVQLNSSGRVGGLQFTGPGWVTPVQGGESLRRRLGVKSNRFRLGVLSLRPQRTRVIFGDRLKLGALVRNLAGGKLERRRHGSTTWQKVTAVAGLKSISPAPRRKVAYRLSGGGASITQTVNVAARVAFGGPQRANGLRGVVRPLSLAGQTVLVQRRARGGWRLVATAKVSRAGTWRARFAVRRGVYRARITPPGSTGLVRGTSPTLTVEFRRG
jgi:stage II sporulation protein D